MCECLHRILCLHLWKYLFSQSLHRCDVDTAALCVVKQHPKNGKLCTDGLPAARWSANKDIVIAVVHSIEH